MSQPQWKKGCPPNDGTQGMYVVCYDDWYTGDTVTALAEWASRNCDTVLVPYYPSSRCHDDFPNGIDRDIVTEYYGPIPYLDI